jgi:putative intracellular protease/amidase
MFRRADRASLGRKDMSFKDPNVVNTKARKRVAMVLANPAVSQTTGWPVGFWWAELTHPYFVFEEQGYDTEVFSYEGGAVQADAMSDPNDPSGYSKSDLISQGFIHSPQLVALIAQTRDVSQIEVDRFDAIVVAGGQAPMVTMHEQKALHRKFVEFYLAGKVAAALCHGSSILRYARLPSGELLAKGKTVTGFANVEEDFADDAVWSAGLLPRDKHVQPWRIEDELKKLGVNYVQAGLWRGFAIRDGNLVTGQQNFSGIETARAIVQALGE